MSHGCVLTHRLALVCAFMLVAQAYIISTPSRPVFRPSRSLERSRMCARNTPCVWAVCSWSQSLIVSVDNCSFVSSGCKCPRGQRCRRTSEVNPDNGSLTIPFTCQ
ncbi:uncharacterized protein LOC131940238 [Physella acuta]|uniref:uncharacterized protein LOC131940238 n=1 Tax=Physella acuta TaxID=109671 RepID=UPI0027DCB1E9|nr:uncharacterized protein LOC131940238 [Physella acuta]